MTETAKLVVAVDSTQVKQAEEDLSSLATTSAKTEKQVDQLGDQLQETAGKAVGLGKAAKPVADGVAKVGSSSGKAAPHLADFSEAAKKAGLSTGQYNQAMRLLPMQLTDVVTSLSSGMPLWMVAIQQGGQVRDSFGGIGNAARAVVSAINPMAAAVSLGVAALAGLGAAYYEGSQEAARFNEALILTGGYARLTAGDLVGMAQQMDALSGVTQSSASAALTQVAATGQFAGEQILLVATAAEQMRDATGKAVEDTIAEFLKLGGDPVKAILDLNDQYHFLDQSQLDQIRSLQEQGRHQAAASEAMRVYAGVIAERTPQILENLGWVEKGWRAIQKGARETLDDVLSIGRNLSPQQRINDLLAERYRLQANESRILMSASQKKAVQERVAAINAEIKAIQDKRVEEIKAANAPGTTVDSDAERARKQAQEQFDRIALSNLDKKARLEKELADIRELGLKAGKSQAEIDSQIAAAQQRYADSLPKGRKTSERAYTDDASTRLLQQLRQQEASLRSQLGTSDKLTSAQRAQAEFAQQIADLKSKAILTADQKSLLASQDAITAQLAKNAAIETEIQKRQELAKLTERSAQLQKSIDQTLSGQRTQNSREIDGYGLGARERERIASEAAIRDRFQSMQDELNEATPASMLDSAEYLEATANITRGMTAALDENASAWGRSQEAMGDWSRGASEAFANYMTEAQNIAGQTEYMIGSALESLTQGIGDSFAQAIVYGDDLRASLQGVAQTILTQLISSIIQMGVRWAINAALGQAMAAAATASSVAMASTLAAAWAPAAAAASLATGGTNSVGAIAGITATNAAAMGFAQGGGGAAGFATGGYVAGPGTGTSDDIPAWLSNGEFVTREAVVSQPGAKSFLESFNARGMAAVDDYARRVRHATGGLAGVPAPALPSPSMGSSQLADPGKALSATVNNRQTFNLIDSPERIASALNTPAGQEAFTVMLSNDPAKFRSILGV